MLGNQRRGELEVSQDGFRYNQFRELNVFHEINSLML